MWKKILFPCLLLLCQRLAAQTDDERTAIIATIQKLFDGMRAGDSAAVRSVFDPSARLQTTYTSREGVPSLRTETIDGFVAAIGTPHDEVWDERIWSYDVRIDGLLATAWTEYTFNAGEKMSHCGVNAFQLFKTAGGDWKIIQITDTRRRTNCQTEPNADEPAVHALLDVWHHAAAVADEDTFFGSMTPDAVYLGTDASERWLRDELREWSKKYFERETAWAFKPKSRQVYFSQGGVTAWFEEHLDTRFGVCRGSGILQKQPDGTWKIRHYNLAAAVPNEVMDAYIQLLKKKE
jgi:ketosteroid isomerase-like protein